MVDIYNHSMTPSKYEIERGGVRWPLPFKKNTFDVSNHLKIFKKGQPDPLCSLPLSDGVVKNTIMVGDDIITITKTYMTILPKGGSLYKPPW